MRSRDRGSSQLNQPRREQHVPRNRGLKESVDPPILEHRRPAGTRVTMFSTEPEKTATGDSVHRLVAEAERFSAMVRQQIAELVATRDGILQTARREAAEFQQEATEEIESLLAEARTRAERVLAEARVKAGEITRSAREDADRLAALGSEYRTTLETALRAVDGLPGLPPPPRPT